MDFSEHRIADLLEELAATDKLLALDLAELDRTMLQQRVDRMRDELARREQFEDAMLRMACPPSSSQANDDGFSTRQREFESRWGR